MRRIDSWLSEYGESHQNPTNKAFHWICIPLIMISLIGLLWSIPSPDIFPTEPFPFTWGAVFVILAIFYYVSLSIPLAIGMLFVGSGLLAANYLIVKYISLDLWLVSIIIFVGAWIGQFIGHKIEGKKPSFFKDLQFLLIGPLWLLHFIYKKLGIPY